MEVLFNTIEFIPIKVSMYALIHEILYFAMFS